MNKQVVIIVALSNVLAVFATTAFATSYEYDDINRLTCVTYDGGFQISYSYDEVGNRTERIATIAADISPDGIVNLNDFAVLGAHWMDANCDIPDWCYRADIDESHSVGLEDLAMISEFWLGQSSYQLTASVISGHGTLTSASYSYVYGSTAYLTAIPDAGYQVKTWTGTDNDSFVGLTNTVLMNVNKSVTVEFTPAPTVVTLTFDTVPSGTALPYNGTYTESGIIVLSKSHNSSFGDQISHGANIWLYFHGTNEYIEFKRADGLTFSLLSFDLLTNGYTGNRWVETSSGTNTLLPGYTTKTTITFTGAGYTNIEWFRVGTPWFATQVDNIAIRLRPE